MSHEIRTPLNAVIGLSEIELRNNLPEPTRDNISRIHQSGASLLGMINDILDISKIETIMEGQTAGGYWDGTWIRVGENHDPITMNQKIVFSGNTYTLSWN